MFWIVLVHVVYGEFGFYTIRGADVQRIILPLWKNEDESDFDQRRSCRCNWSKEEKPNDLWCNLWAIKLVSYGLSRAYTRCSLLLMFVIKLLQDIRWASYRESMRKSQYELRSISDDRCTTERWKKLLICKSIWMNSKLKSVGFKWWGGEDYYFVCSMPNYWEVLINNLSTTIDLNFNSWISVLLIKESCRRSCKSK